MAALCQHFAQNTWRKDLCSNCFKGREEHVSGGSGIEPRTRYLSSVYPSRTMAWRRTDTAPQGILKDGHQTTRGIKGTAVHFPAPESQVIGFGGDDCMSSEGEDADAIEDADDDPCCCDVDVDMDGDEDRALQRLTRSNTDFNTVAANLMGPSSSPLSLPAPSSGERDRRPYTHLLLGQPLRDADGRRRTLFVSVKPFGDTEDARKRWQVDGSLNGMAGEDDGDVLKAVRRVSDDGNPASNNNNNTGEMGEQEEEEEEGVNLKISDNGLSLEKPAGRKISDDDDNNNNNNNNNGDGYNNNNNKNSRMRVGKLIGDKLKKSVVRTAAFKGKCDVQGRKVEENKCKADCPEQLTNNNNHQVKQLATTAHDHGEFGVREAQMRERNEDAVRITKPLVKAKTIDDQKSVNPKTVDDHVVVNPETVDSHIALSPKTVDGHIAVNPKTVDDHVVVNPETVDSHIVLSPKTVDGHIAVSPKTVDGHIAVNPKTVDGHIAANPKTVDGHIAANPKTVDGHIAANPKTVDSQIAVNPKTVDGHIAVNPKTVDGHIAVKPKTVDNQIVVNPKAIDNQIAVNPKTSDTRIAVNLRTSDNQIAVNPKTSDNEIAVNPKTSDTQIAVNLRTSDNQISVSPKTSDNQILVKTKTNDNQISVNPKISDNQISVKAKTINQISVNPKISDNQIAVNLKTGDSHQTMMYSKSVETHQIFSKDNDRKYRVKDGHKMQIKFGTYRKLSSDDPVITKGVCTLSVRRIDGEYKASKVMLVDPPHNNDDDDDDDDDDDLAIFAVEESRELAGEPDGRADSDDVGEPLEVPRSPPPPPPPTADPRPSFLHGLITASARKVLPAGDKPKVPAKPTKVIQAGCRKMTLTAPAEVLASDPCRSHKRQAPRPPSKTSPQEEDDDERVVGVEEGGGGMYDSHPMACKSSSPVAVATPACPEPAPRRSLSVSVDSPAAPQGMGTMATVVPSSSSSDRKKGHGRARFSLRKLLRLGGGSVTATPKEEDRAQAGHNDTPASSSARPRLEIIHPLDLNGTSVEVLSGESKGYEAATAEPQSAISPTHCSAGRPHKPPPPPRSQPAKPSRPPPPKSAELLRQLRERPVQGSVQRGGGGGGHGVYANLGEVRSSLAPSKPQRTASLRESGGDPRRRRGAAHEDGGGYDAVDGEQPHAPPQVPCDHVYEVITLPESEPRSPVTESDPSPDLLKLRGTFVKSGSLPSCGSETGSDMYCPYGDEDDAPPWHSSVLRLRRGRGVVHACLEDNYGAVIVANHEALLQLLDQVLSAPPPPLPPPLRPLRAAPLVRWTDFIVEEGGSTPMAVGRRLFVGGAWGTHPVTLCVAADLGLRGAAAGAGVALTPVLQFTDLVPARLLPLQERPSALDEDGLVMATIAVLPRVHVDTIQSFSGGAPRHPPDEGARAGALALLQLVLAYKQLQAGGVEEASSSLGDAVLVREEHEERAQARLCVLGVPHGVPPGGGASLCRCALAALPHLVCPTCPLGGALGGILHEERAGSLSRAKAVLEYWLWGPTGGGPLGEDPREDALQRWLDLERATALHALVRTRGGVHVSAADTCHLLFLAKTTARAMADAAALLGGAQHCTCLERGAS